MSPEVQKIKVSSDVRALRKAREKLKVTRQELALKLSVNYKTIEKIENGRMALSEERKDQMMAHLGLSEKDLSRIKKGGVVVTQRCRRVTENNHRRSYQKIITKECKVLRSLRRQNGISQDQASALCGYSRPSIGHIENGRIELTKARVLHILDCYGVNSSEFEKCLKKETQRDELVDQCVEKIRSLGEEKLNLLKGILESF